MDQIINYRYANDLDTVFTSNVNPDKLPARIASRLSEGVEVLMNATDYRLLIAERRSISNDRFLPDRRRRGGSLREGGDSIDGVRASVVWAGGDISHGCRFRRPRRDATRLYGCHRREITINGITA